MSKIKSNINIVILGSSVTALAIIRSAAKNGYRVIIVDNVKGIAFYSRYIKRSSIIIEGEFSLNKILFLLDSKQKNYIIATSDSWLKALIAVKYDLDKHRIHIMHPDNKTIMTCLDKQEFSKWCYDHNINHPKTYVFNSKLELFDNIKYPLIARSINADSVTNKIKVPKVVKIKDDDELLNTISYCKDNKIEFIYTESLLDQNLIQYSVPVAIIGDKYVSCVIEKVRPTPISCAVGSYVKLSPNPEIENIAITVLKSLKYYGIAEVEILYSVTNSIAYVIEVNPRPWTQFALVTKSNHNFLKFIVDNNSYDRSIEIKSGMAWIALQTDIYYCFSRSNGMLINKNLTVYNYITSLLLIKSCAIFCLDDLWPFIASLRKKK